MKKKYNPFRMWGSYAGAVIGIILSWNFLVPVIKTNAWFTPKMYGGCDLTGFCSDAMATPYPIYVLLIVGFLLGWGIHSLFRRFNK